ncbi:hypothetical protein CA267_015640 [Alteromonas pelagimontana]|uniref:Prepilin-type N-terminal cleavage/methylation domain-containing protein n=1 Tax=Alteromonas pelagimontana TaxID=1858656 RepID=A0A6M4MHI9_9ALTE|nr:hypothetical protein [Alteromonas pelagimontana]QJR82080.1 hypothetical protein CA267_015640 [Alteromonas pelagimontana]
MKQQGFTYIEVAIATVIVALSAQSMIMLTQNWRQFAESIFERHAANFLLIGTAQDFQLLAANQAADAFAQIEENSGAREPAGLTTINLGSANPSASFSRNWHVSSQYLDLSTPLRANFTSTPQEEIRPTIKQITVTINWTDADGDVKSITTSVAIRSPAPGSLDNFYQLNMTAGF